MCGIVGLMNGGSVASGLIDGLRSLEYRGYDSAGLATVHNGHLDRRRAQGKLINLEGVLGQNPLDGAVGIGHTRWATHGAPTEINAHPHLAGSVALVHNGIIENHRALRTDLEAQGVVFESETDTEVLLRLIAARVDVGMKPVAATCDALSAVEGQYAVCAVFADYDNLMVAARKDSPLSIGRGDHEVQVASDMLAFGDRAKQVMHLENGDIAVIQREGIRIVDLDGRPQKRFFQPAARVNMAVGKDGYRHFMHKEIHQQPATLAATLAEHADGEAYRARNLPQGLIEANAVDIVACGTSFYAGQVGRFWLEEFAGVRTDTDIASEYKYRPHAGTGSTAGLFISQSGETADTLACLRQLKDDGQATVTIVNVPTSTMAREASATVPTVAGPEIGVASTKAFTAQLATLFVLARSLGEARGHIDGTQAAVLDNVLAGVPDLVADALELEPEIEAIARDIKDASNALFLGRGSSHPLAMEGALKLKEVSYIHAEGYAAGELKHGPIALIDETMPVVVIAPRDRWFRKTASNLREVTARFGKVILISDAEGVEELRDHVWHAIAMPDCTPEIAPIVYSVPLQLLAYHVALARGTDMDQPRNLAKSVTVE